MGNFLFYSRRPQSSIDGSDMEMCGAGDGGVGLEMVLMAVQCLSNLLKQASIPDTFTHYIVQ